MLSSFAPAAVVAFNFLARKPSSASDSSDINRNMMKRFLCPPQARYKRKGAITILEALNMFGKLFISFNLQSANDI
jgi:hypothetical protein